MKKYRLTNWNNFTDKMYSLDIINSVCEVTTQEQQDYIDRLTQRGDFIFEEIKETVRVNKHDAEERSGDVGKDDSINTATEKPSGSRVRGRGRPKVNRSNK